MKFEVKTGNEFDGFVVIEVKEEKSSSFTFKNFVIGLSFVAVTALAGYSVVTGDYTMFDKILGAVVEVAKAAMKPK